MTGIVRNFNVDRGFGFITPLIGKPDEAESVFFHVSGIKRFRGGHRPAIPQGAQVKFRLCRGDQGPQAFDIEINELPVSALTTPRKESE